MILNSFPDISFLLKLLTTFQSFDFYARTHVETVKRIKDYLRNSTGQERLTGVALLSVHRRIKIDADDGVDDVVHKKRMLDFTQYK